MSMRINPSYDLAFIASSQNASPLVQGWANYTSSDGFGELISDLNIVAWTANGNNGRAQWSINPDLAMNKAASIGGWKMTVAMRIESGGYITNYYANGSIRYLPIISLNANGDLIAELEGGDSYVLVSKTGSEDYHIYEIEYLPSLNKAIFRFDNKEIETWADIEKLGKKAHQFKPKLDKMQEKIVGQKLAEQEHKKEQQQQAASAYMDNVYNTLSTGQLGDLKLDKKVQNQLYSGLVQPNYPSISGKPTNLLGHLLEKYQFVEPRHDLIAEALWLLSDPNGYKSKIQEQGSRQAVEKTVRQLKTAQSQKISSSTVQESNSNSRKKPTRKPTVQRKNNMFKRF